MARGWRGAGALAGLGKGLDQAGDAFLQVALAKRGFALREQQMGQQQEQFKQTMDVRNRMAKVYEDRAQLKNVGSENFFSDLHDFLEGAPPSEASLPNVRAGAAGFRQQGLIPPTESRTPASQPPDMQVAQTTVPGARRGPALLDDLDAYTQRQPDTWKRWIPK